MDTHAITIKLAADIADLLSKMKIAESAVGGAVGKIKSSFNGMLATLGAGISIAGLAAFVKTAINSADALDEMSGRVGVSAKELSSLQLAFRQAGMSNEDMGSSLSKLSKQMADGNKMFDAMGVKVKNTDGTLRGTTSVLSDVADQFAGMQDGAGKTALAIELFGKSGAAMVPLLNGGSEGIREMTEMATKLGLVIEDSTAAQAGKFNDTLELLQLGVTGVGQGIAAQLLPTLNGLAGEFLTTMTSGDKLKNTADFLSTALKILYIGGIGIIEVFSSVGKVVGGTAAAIMAALSGNFSEAKSIMAALSGDVKSGWTAAATSMKAAWETQGNAAVDAAAKGIGANRNLIAEQKKREESEKAGASTAAAALKAQESFIKGLEKESDKLQLTNTQAKLKEAALLGIKGKTLEHVKALLEEDDAYKKAVKSAQDRADARKKESDGIEAYMLAQTEGYAAAVKGSQDALAAAKDEYDQFGLTKSQIAAITLVRLEDQLVTKTAGSESYEAIQKQIEAQRELISVMKGTEGLEASKKVNDEKVADWKKTIDQYDDIFRTGFSAMINGGQGAWKSFTKSLATTFKTSVADQIYKSFAQPFVVKFVASMLGVTGSGLAGAAQAAGTGSSLLSGASAASSLYSMGSATFGGLASGATSLGSILGATGSSVATAATYGTAIGSTQTAMLAASEAGMGLTGTLGSLTTALGAIPVWGWVALAGLAAVAMLQGGETRNGASYITGTDGKASKEMGPSGGEIAGTQARAMFDTAKTSIEGLLTGMGSKAVLTGYVAGLESSENGKGFAYAGGQINGLGFGESGGRNGGQFAMGDKSPDQALKDYQLNLTQSILEGLQITADLPASVAKLIRDGLNGAEVKDLSLEATNAILASVSKLSGEVTTFGAAMDLLPFERLKTLSFDTTAGLMAAAGGFDALVGNLGGFYQNFFTSEEQRAQSITNTSAAFEALGLTMPTLDDGARAAYKAMVLKAEAELDGTDATARAYTALLALQGPMNELAPTFDSIAQAAADLAADAALALTSLRANIDRDLASLGGTTDAVASAATAAADAARAANNALADAGSGILAFVSSITGGAIEQLKNSAQSVAQMKARYEADLVGAQAGDLAASANIAKSGQAYLTAQIDNSSTAVDARRAAALMANDLRNLPAALARQQSDPAASAGKPEDPFLKLMKDVLVDLKKFTKALYETELSDETVGLLSAGADAIYTALNTIKDADISLELKLQASTVINDLANTMTIGVQATYLDDFTKGLLGSASQSLAGAMTVVVSSVYDEASKSLGVLLLGQTQTTLDVLVTAKDLDPEVRRLALAAVNGFNGTVALAFSTQGMSAADIASVLDLVGTLNRTVKVSLTMDSLTDDAKLLASMTATTVTKTINFAITDLTGIDKDIALAASGKVTRVLELAIGQSDPLAIRLAEAGSYALNTIVSASNGEFTPEVSALLSEGNLSQMIVFNAQINADKFHIDIAPLLAARQLSVDAVVGDTQAVTTALSSLTATQDIVLNALFRPGDTRAEITGLATAQGVVFNASLNAGATPDQLAELAQAQRVEFTATLNVGAATEAKDFLALPGMVGLTAKLDTQSALDLKAFVLARATLELGTDLDTADARAAKQLVLDGATALLTANLSTQEAAELKRVLLLPDLLKLGTHLDPSVAQGVKSDLLTAANLNITASLTGGAAYANDLATLTAPVTQTVTINTVSGGTFNPYGSGPTGTNNGYGTGFGGDAYALGGVFGSASLTAFAKGGLPTNSVLSSPFFFDMGLAGEAGPEAIMPLKRGPDGNLGVRADIGVQSYSVQAPSDAARNETNALLARLLASNEAMTSELSLLRQSGQRVEKHTEASSKTLTNVTRGGDAMQVAATKSGAVLAL